MRGANHYISILNASSPVRKNLQKPNLLPHIRLFTSKVH
jgi:hypothetical protein